MKIISIPEQHDIDIGPYGPACEGFIDTLKYYLSEDPSKKRLKELAKRSNYSKFVLKKELERDLSLTYENPTWVSKRLEGNSGFAQSKALEHANVSGKAITDPAEIVRIAKLQLEVIKDIARHEKPFIAFRQKLTEQLDKITDPAKADKIWEENEYRLRETPVDRFRKRHKKHFTALGQADDGKNAWPVNYKDPKESQFNSFCSITTDGKLEAPTPQNAAKYAQAIRDLLQIILEVDKITDECYVSYWDGIPVEYDELEYGDEIFSYIYSSQDNWEVYDLSSGLSYELDHMLAAIYIIMFDKHKGIGEPATEGIASGILDFFKGKEKSESNADADSSAEMERIYAWLKENIKNGRLNPDLQLNGRPIQLSATRSKLFFKRGAAPANIDSLIRGWTDDLAVLKKLFNASKADARKASSVETNLEKSLERLVKSNENVTWEAYRAEILKFKGQLPAPSKEKYQNYPYVFFGNSNSGLVEDNKLFGEFTHQPLTESDIDRLVKLANEFSMLWIQASDLEERMPVGIDCTDWPFRQFASEIWEDPETNSIISAMDGVSGTFRDNYALPVEFVENRANLMELAVWMLVRAAYE